MRYLGGKSRVVPFLLPLITGMERTRYVEPFVGGGSVLAAAARHFREVEAGDAHPSLVAAWNAVLSGWTPPGHVSEGEYQALRDEATPSPLQGYAGFACSFGGKWFGGYARNSDGSPDQESSRASLLRKATALRTAGVEALYLRSFEDYEADASTVIYCDPPYVTSADYSTARWRPYDFWDKAAEWVEAGAVVLVSEFQAPRQWIECATTMRTVAVERTSSARSSVAERVFAHESQAEAVIRVQRETDLGLLALLEDGAAA